MDLKDRLSLDEQLCFALYSTSLAMTQFYKEQLDAIGITYTQYTILLILWENDGVNLKFIADRLGQKSGAVTPVIKRMEVDGLVQRIRSLEDERELQVVLTKKGTTLKEKAYDINQCVAETCMASSVDVVRLRDQLNILKAELRKK
jgi:MarR family transcriptional regulator, organic hydroperoxide resistance regulator